MHTLGPQTPLKKRKLKKKKKLKRSRFVFMTDSLDATSLKVKLWLQQRACVYICNRSVLICRKMMFKVYRKYEIVWKWSSIWPKSHQWVWLITWLVSLKDGIRCGFTLFYKHDFCNKYSLLKVFLTEWGFVWFVGNPSQIAFFARIVKSKKCHFGHFV